eukprot:scaffold926_cov408-Prasinococcus_capsulatus_cf.AAC.30
MSELGRDVRWRYNRSTAPSVVPNAANPCASQLQMPSADHRIVERSCQASTLSERTLHMGCRRGIAHPRCIAGTQSITPYSVAAVGSLGMQGISL